MLAIEQEENGPLDYQKTIIAAARGSVGSGEYRNVFICRENGNEDVTYDGEFSCAISTSAIFHRYGLLLYTHTTVNGFQDEVVPRDDWLETETLLPGAVGILEGKRHLDGSVKSRHTFIYIGDGMTVHNGFEDGLWAPRLCAVTDFKHHTGEQRFVEVAYLHKLLA